VFFQKKDVIALPIAPATNAVPKISGDVSAPYNKGETPAPNDVHNPILAATAKILVNIIFFPF